MELLMLQQIKEFQIFLKRFKAAEDAHDALFEAGKEPTRKEEKKLEALKKEYQEYMSFFESTEVHLAIPGWEMLSTLDMANRLVVQTFGGK